ncbi:MAG: GTP-binding protein [Cocleimonas sp.]|nr:GTP-binding protein [Cocleimonas sp.]
MPNWSSIIEKNKPVNIPTQKPSGDTHLALAKESLAELLNDSRVPANVRDSLREDYAQLRLMLTKLEKSQLHVSVFGRVSVGKSSVLNALLGREAFSVSILHGETTRANMQEWQEVNAGGIYLIDTPGINEIDGEERERIAHRVASRSDLLLFVIDSDVTEVELQALKTVAESNRPIILVVNKSDQYNDAEILKLRGIIRERVAGIIAPENIVFSAALPAKQTIIMVDEAGNETETTRQRPVDILNVKSRLWDIIESEGKTLSALNASLFAGSLSEEVGKRILVARQKIGEETIRMYCIGKGVAVALNPIPIVDIVAAAAIDVGMVIHLSNIYGLPMTKTEAGDLIKTIAAQMLLLYGSFWAINFASSALKITTVGLSTLLTGAAQGAIAWYSTLIIGRVTEDYLINGKSWGEVGPKLAVQSILDSLDRDSVMSEAKEEIMRYLKKDKARQ